ncbi:efflux RND transporter periplasmic adaptor subunit [Paludisphaera borealis]|nr:efflux RND transporter periplasmic adaptor subunit [Paludisphaera borealis]
MKRNDQTMTTIGDPSATHPRPDSARAGHGGDPSKGSRLGWILKLLIVVACVGGFAYLERTGKLPKPVQDAYEQAKGLVLHTAEHSPPPDPRDARAPSKTTWHGLVEVDDDQIEALSLKVVAVRAQTDPIKLELTGRTAYNENSLTKIRPRFDTLVEGVLAEKGRRVKKGDPLVALFSTELATAKNAYQTNYVQWQHDLRLLKLREKLVKTGAISEQTFVDTKNDESKSRLGYYTSWENLRVLGVPDSEIEPLIANLGEAPTAEHLLNIADKAKMTLRSPVDGIVVQRDVAPGNLYDNSNVLMVIAPVDKLWVMVNVYERDQSKVALGQRMTIQFPFLQKTAAGVVEYVASEVSKDSRAVQARASIPNPDGSLKADMLVRAVLDVPPIPGQTVVPRLSMVVINGDDYVFVRKRSESGPEKRFERRKVVVAQESSDFVIIHNGLEAGEEVVTNGSLILAQLYEDLQMVNTGMPPN